MKQARPEVVPSGLLLLADFLKGKRGREGVRVSGEGGLGWGVNEEREDRHV